MQYKQNIKWQITSYPLSPKIVWHLVNILLEITFSTYKYYFKEVVTDTRRRQWHLTPVLLPGNFHGWGSLVGCSPWGREESDTTEGLPFHFTLSCIGEGNGNPLQCSCLENPRDGEAWWAAVSGVAQNWTRLTWLSSSRNSAVILSFCSLCVNVFFSLWLLIKLSQSFWEI